MPELDAMVIQTSWRGVEITAAALRALILSILANRNAIVHGEQSLQKLNLQNKKLESVQLAQDDIKAFKRELKRYAVDFHVMKNKETGERTVYFKGQDIDRIYSGLENCIKNIPEFQVQNASKRKMNEVMQEAVEKAAAKNEEKAAPDKTRVADRGQEL